MRAWWAATLVWVISPAAVAEDDERDKADEHEEVQDIAPEEPEKPAPKPDAPPPRVEPPQRDHVHTMDEVTVPTSYLRFGINFFGDTSFLVTTPAQPHTAFAIGALGVRMLGQLSPALDALAEVAFETANGEPLADVEQVLIRWRAGRGLLELGRMHTDLGFWNRAYHHGLWLQIPIERPHALRFEDDGGIIPVHWIGAHYTLDVTQQFAIVTGVGNGRGDDVDDILVGSETNEAKSALIKLRYKIARSEIGIGAVYDLIAPADAMTRPALPDERIHELIANGYVALRGDGPIAVAEGYAIMHRTAGEAWMTYSAFALLGYAVTEKVTPYAAVDMILGVDEDPFFRPDPATTAAVDSVEAFAGLRVDVSTWSALKFEARFEHPLSSGGENAYTGAANFSFGL